MKQSKTVQDACDLLIKRVRFETACLSLTPGKMSNDEDTDRIREATRIYVESWIVPSLEAIRDGDTERLKLALS